MAHTKKQELLPVESTAALEGGAAAGKYLEQLGKTDMAAMNVTEWKAFCVKKPAPLWLAKPKSRYRFELLVTGDNLSNLEKQP